MTMNITVECSDPELAAREMTRALTDHLGTHKIHGGVKVKRSPSDRPEFTGPWRRDPRVRCWWRPYRIPLGSETYVHSSRVIFDDGTFWP